MEPLFPLPPGSVTRRELLLIEWIALVLAGALALAGWAGQWDVLLAVGLLVALPHAAGLLFVWLLPRDGDDDDFRRGGDDDDRRPPPRSPRVRRGPVRTPARSPRPHAPRTRPRVRA